MQVETTKQFLMKIKTVLLLLLSGLIAASCSKERREEKAVEQSLESFYEYINKRDFKAVASVCSPQMHKSIDFVKNFGDDLVVYKDWTVKSVKISGDKAVAKVLATDRFDNRTECIWRLCKVKGKWLLDVFNFSSAESLNTNDKSTDEAPTKAPAEAKDPITTTSESTTAEV